MPSATQAADAVTWFGLAAADWAILIVYLLGITAIGTWSYRRVKGMDAIFMGGRGFGKLFMMYFAFGSGTSSEQAVTVSAGAFRQGLAGIWYQFLYLWSTPFYWLIAPVFRRMRALTTSDFFEARYDTATATLYSCLGMLISVVFISANLFGSGAMIEGLAGGINPATGEPYLPKAYAIAAMTVMFVVYGMAGGLKAAIITDFVQGILTIVFSFLVLPFALHVAAQVTGAPGGFAALHVGNPERPGMLDLTLNETIARAMGQEPITFFYIAMLSATGLLGVVVQPHMMGNCAAGKTEFEGRFGVTCGNFIKRICTIAWTFTGLACIIIYLTPETPYLSADAYANLQGDPDAQRAFADQVFGRAAHDILPAIAPGLVGLLFASLLAAVMSTCDAQMVVSSGLFTENIYRRFIRPDASSRHYLWVGRIAGLAIVGMALLMLTQYENVVQVLTTYVQALPVFMGAAFWFGVTWRRYTPKGVWASTLVTALFWYLTQLHTPSQTIASLGSSPFLQRNIDYLPWLFRSTLHDWFPFMMIERTDALGVNFKTSVPYQMLIYASTGVIAGVIVSLVTRPVAAAKLDRFFRLLRTPIRPGEQVGAPCTLPEDPLPADDSKLVNVPSLEIPRPTRIGIVGFLAAWVVVGLIIWLTKWLSTLGAAA